MPLCPEHSRHHLVILYIEDVDLNVKEITWNHEEIVILYIEDVDLNT